jgi:hypothetical protein
VNKYLPFHSSSTKEKTSMSTSNRKIILIICVMVLSSLSCFILPFNKSADDEYAGQEGIALSTRFAKETNAVKEGNNKIIPPEATDEQTTSQDQPQEMLKTQTAVPPSSENCIWVLTDTTEALATGGGAPGMSVKREDYVVTTSYTFAGNQGCPDQTFSTRHAWVGLKDKLVPGQWITLSVVAEFALYGSSECAAISPGIGTYLTVPGIPTIKVVDDKLEEDISMDILEGRISEHVDWLAPFGAPGDTLTIKGTAASGSLGGSVFYHYTCQSTAP